MVRRSESCQFPKCREPPYIEYLGKRLCERHWDMCERDGGNFLRRKLGLPTVSVSRPEPKPEPEPVREKKKPAVARKPSRKKKAAVVCEPERKVVDDRPRCVSALDRIRALQAR